MILRYISSLLKLSQKENSRENSSWLEQELKFYKHLSEEAKRRGFGGLTHRPYIQKHTISGEDYS